MALYSHVNYRVNRSVKQALLLGINGKHLVSTLLLGNGASFRGDRGKGYSILHSSLLIYYK